jgi:hypothetical protein
MGMKSGGKKLNPNVGGQNEGTTKGFNLQNMKYLDPSFVDQYKEAGEKYLYELK